MVHYGNPFIQQYIRLSLLVHGEVHTQSVVQQIKLSAVMSFPLFDVGSEVISSVWWQQLLLARASLSQGGGVKPSLHSTALSKGLLFKRFLNAGENYSLINSVLYWIQFTPYYWIEMHHEFISNNNLADAFYQSMLQYSADMCVYVLPL